MAAVLIAGVALVALVVFGIVAHTALTNSRKADIPVVLEKLADLAKSMLRRH
ncbi:hypothetical protein [Kitasatospora paracochleata]|uniref:Beta-lactam-binding protein with PASTA domain n=1 Tax=Kitasatospora paracochleata TaxID=58354 RepID=A0ABT1J9V9_9ACTN|nr:hypothetical protein [Kitasatospora paracochleata]MCP2314244.1 beta-lactam-binding protein with PASTA domain [Kitasatospora paracochleata]